MDLNDFTSRLLSNHFWYWLVLFVPVVIYLGRVLFLISLGPWIVKRSLWVPRPLGHILVLLLSIAVAIILLTYEGQHQWLRADMVGWSLLLISLGFIRVARKGRTPRTRMIMSWATALLICSVVTQYVPRRRLMLSGFDKNYLWGQGVALTTFPFFDRSVDEDFRDFKWAIWYPWVERIEGGFVDNFSGLEYCKRLKSLSIMTQSVGLESFPRMPMLEELRIFGTALPSEHIWKEFRSRCPNLKRIEMEWNGRPACCRSTRDRTRCCGYVGWSWAIGYPEIETLCVGPETTVDYFAELPLGYVKQIAFYMSEAEAKELLPQCAPYIPPVGKIPVVSHRDRIEAHFDLERKDFTFYQQSHPRWKAAR